jgi:hypothetical protein
VDAELRRCLARLDEPLRVALAGTLKSGKSTLLNALVGEEIAPTDATECTRVVTWFAHGRSPRAEVARTDGRLAELPLRRADGRLALDLGGIPEERVDHVAVGWPSSLLADYTVIDTPGTSSNSRAVSARTEAFLTPRDGECAADAVVYLTRTPQSCDLALLRRMRDHPGGGHGPLGVIGVLSRADELDGAQPGSLDAARRLGGVASREPGVPEWIAVSGLLALRGRTLRQTEFAALAALAALPATERETVLISPGRFRTALLPVPEAVRESLLTGFGLGGIRTAVGLIRTGAHDAPALAAALVAHSGLDTLSEALSVRFGARAAELKAHSALRVLRGVLAGLPPRNRQPRLLRMVDRALADDHLYVELRTLAGLAMLPVSQATREALERVLGGRGTSAAARLGLADGARREELAEAALAGARSWRAGLDDPMLAGPARRAHVAAARSCEAILAQVGGTHR